MTKKNVSLSSEYIKLRDAYALAMEILETHYQTSTITANTWSYLSDHFENSTEIAIELVELGEEQPKLGRFKW